MTSQTPAHSVHGTHPFLFWNIARNHRLEQGHTEGLRAMRVANLVYRKSPRVRCTKNIEQELYLRQGFGSQMAFPAKLCFRYRAANTSDMPLKSQLLAKILFRAAARLCFAGHSVGLSFSAAPAPHAI